MADLEGLVVGRTLILSPEGMPLLGDSIAGGVTLDGASTLEIATTLRLVNRDQPRTDF